MPTFSLDQLRLLIFALVPGYVAVIVYDLLIPSKRDIKHTFAVATIVSLLNCGLFCWLVVPVNLGDFWKEHYVQYAAVALLVCIIAPALEAWGWYCFRTSRWLHDRCPWIGRHFDCPNRSAWDDFFRRRQPCFIRFHLKTTDRATEKNTIIGGFFGSKSYVTCSPDDPEVYVETMIYVDQATGKFGSYVPDTAGFLIKQSECVYLEFSAITQGEAECQQSQETATAEKRATAEAERLKTSANGQHLPKSLPQGFKRVFDLMLLLLSFFKRDTSRSNRRQGSNRNQPLPLHRRAAPVVGPKLPQPSNGAESNALAIVDPAQAPLS